jgi:hypothetical protein
MAHGQSMYFRAQYGISTPTTDMDGVLGSSSTTAHCTNGVLSYSGSVYTNTTQNRGGKSKTVIKCVGTGEIDLITPARSDGLDLHSRIALVTDVKTLERMICDP